MALANKSEETGRAIPEGAKRIIGNIKRLDATWNAVKDAEQIARAAKHNLRNILLSGNGGGLVATLGLLGTIIGTSPDSRGPRELLFLTAIFCLGLIASGIAAYSDWLASHAFRNFDRAKANVLHDIESTWNSDETMCFLDEWLEALATHKRWRSFERSMALVAATWLALGIVGAAVVLWSLTEWFLVQP